MKEFIPLKVLCKEAERALEGLSKKEWKGNSDGYPYHFSFWWSGNHIAIKRAISLDPMSIDYFTTHFLEIHPRKMKAYFYNNYTDYPKEERRTIESNLRARGYKVEERDCIWFNADKDKRKYLDKEVYATA